MTRIHHLFSVMSPHSLRDRDLYACIYVHICFLCILCCLTHTSHCCSTKANDSVQLQYRVRVQLLLRRPITTQIHTRKTHVCFKKKQNHPFTHPTVSFLQLSKCYYCWYFIKWCISHFVSLLVLLKAEDMDEEELRWPPKHKTHSW